MSSATEVWFESSICYPFFKGRVALWALLKCLDLHEGDEVLVPGFTCVVVPAAVIYTGAIPVYYDIDPRTLNGDPQALLRAIGPRTRAAVIQHSFGNPAATASVIDRLRSRGIAVIEDCAHAIGATLHGNPVGTLGDAAFTSFQWSKIVSTGLGGMARANTPELATELHHIWNHVCTEPSIVVQWNLRLLSLAYRHLYKPWMYWSARSLYHRASRLGFLRGSSDRCELTAAQQPPDYATRFGRRRRSELASIRRRLDLIVEHRRRIADHYEQRLSSWSIPRPIRTADADPVPLRVPLWSRARTTLLERAAEKRIEIGDWFNAPLHPDECPPDAFHYQRGSCPHGERAATQLINLPTHPNVSVADADRILRFLTDNRELLSESFPSASVTDPD